MSLNVEKDFLSNVDYLKSLVKEVKSKPISDFDSNLIYEVTYADMYVSDLLTKVNNKNIAENINDIKSSLDLIISSIPKSDIVDARKKSDYTKILKAKYGNADEGSFEEEVAYSNVGESSIVREYLIKRASSIVLIFVLCTILVFNVDVIDILKDITSALVDFLHGFGGMSSEPHTVSADSKATLDLINKVFSMLLNFVIILIVGMGVVCSSVDLLYLTIPAMRFMLDGNEEGSKMISIYAKSAIEEVDGQLIKYKKIKSYDRIKRNQYWLQSMIDTLTSLEQSGKDVDKGFVKSLIDLQSDIKSCSKNSNKWYMNIAKIEFLHDKYIEQMKGVA